jgi:pimeloyl-ACP methyl ester carboxylesterase
LWNIVAITRDNYSYEASTGGKINTLQSEIDYYKRDFDDYYFDRLEENIKVEKDNYSRWSTLLEEAAKDLIRIEDKKFKDGTGIKAKKVEGAGHMLHWDKPNEVVEKILNWFK